MARKKSRQTFEKLKREQAVKARRALKQERKEAARIAKASEDSAVDRVDGEEAPDEEPDLSDRGSADAPVEPDGHLSRSAP